MHRRETEVLPSFALCAAVMLGVLTSLSTSLVTATSSITFNAGSLGTNLDTAYQKLDARDDAYAAAIKSLQVAADWAAGNATSKAQVASDLLTLTLQAQAVQADALAAAAQLLTASLASTQVYLQDVRLTTAIIIDGMGLEVITQEARDAYQACLDARGLPDGTQWSWNVSTFATPARDSQAASNSTILAGARKMMRSLLARFTGADVAVDDFDGYEVATFDVDNNTVLNDGKALPRYAGHDGANRVLGGLFLHATRKPIADVTGGGPELASSPACQRPFRHLVAICSGSVKTSTLKDLQGVGNDAVFNKLSQLYDKDLNYTDWYDSDPSHGQVTESGTPFGFFHHPIQGFPEGYPVLLDNVMSHGRATQLLAYLSDGSFLDSMFGDTLRAQLVTFNSEAGVFGYWTMTVTWGAQGQLPAKFQAMALPAVEYNKDPSYWDMRKVAPDLALLLLVFMYTLMTLMDFYSTLRMQFKFKELHTEDDTVQKYRTRSKVVTRVWRFSSRLTLGWALYEVALCAVMIGAIAVFYIYTTRIAATTRFSTQFYVYDAVGYAPARFLLPARTADSIAAANDTGMVVPAGAPGRYNLIEDLGPMQQLGDMYTAADEMYYLVVLYYFFQGVALVMLFIHGIHYIQFQPRLALIAKVLGTILPDIAHFLLIYVIMDIMFACALNIALGTRIKDVASFDEAIVNLLLYTLLGDGVGERILAAAMDPTLEGVSGGERILATILRFLLPLLMFHVMFAFLLAILLQPYILLRMQAVKSNTVWKDISERIGWLYQQHGPGRAPGNKDMDRLVDLLLMEQTQRTMLKKVASTVSDMLQPASRAVSLLVTRSRRMSMRLSGRMSAVAPEPLPSAPAPVINLAMGPGKALPLNQTQLEAKLRRASVVSYSSTSGMIPTALSQRLSLPSHATGTGGNFSLLSGADSRRLNTHDSIASNSGQAPSQEGQEHSVVAQNLLLRMQSQPDQQQPIRNRALSQSTRINLKSSMSNRIAPELPRPNSGIPSSRSVAPPSPFQGQPFPARPRSGHLARSSSRFDPQAAASDKAAPPGITSPFSMPGSMVVEDREEDRSAMGTDGSGPLPPLKAGLGGMRPSQEIGYRPEPMSPGMLPTAFHPTSLPMYMTRRLIPVKTQVPGASLSPVPLGSPLPSTDGLNAPLAALPPVNNFNTTLSPQQQSEEKSNLALGQPQQPAIVPSLDQGVAPAVQPSGSGWPFGVQGTEPPPGQSPLAYQSAPQSPRPPSPTQPPPGSPAVSNDGSTASSWGAIAGMSPAPRVGTRGSAVSSILRPASARSGRPGSGKPKTLKFLASELTLPNGQKVPLGPLSTRPAWLTGFDLPLLEPPGVTSEGIRTAQQEWGLLHTRVGDAGPEQDYTQAVLAYVLTLTHQAARLAAEVQAAADHTWGMARLVELSAAQWDASGGAANHRRLLRASPSMNASIGRSGPLSVATVEDVKRLLRLTATPNASLRQGSVLLAQPDGQQNGSPQGPKQSESTALSPRQSGGTTFSRRQSINTVPSSQALGDGVAPGNQGGVRSVSRPMQPNGVSASPRGAATILPTTEPGLRPNDNDHSNAILPAPPPITAPSSAPAAAAPSLTDAAAVAASSSLAPGMPMATPLTQEPLEMQSLAVISSTPAGDLPASAAEAEHHAHSALGKGRDGLCEAPHTVQGEAAVGAEGQMSMGHKAPLRATAQLPGQDA